MIAAMAAIRHPTMIGYKRVFLEGKRILVTGGTGLVGKTYFKGIQTSGHEAAQHKGSTAWVIQGIISGPRPS